MKRYLVSIEQVVCADLEIKADSEEVARQIVMSSGIDPQEYCEGHQQYAGHQQHRRNPRGGCSLG